MADEMECGDFGLSNVEAVSLFTSSLNKALEKKHSSLIVTIAELTQQLAKKKKINPPR